MRIITIFFFCLFVAGVSGKAQNSTPAAVVPFEMENGIVLTLRINDSDRPLRFLFDTGADGMAIRKTLADSLALTVSRTQEAQIVGGSKQISISAGNRILLGDSLILENQSIALFDYMGRGLDGIIGLNLAWHYIVNVNCEAKLMKLYKFGQHIPDSEGESEQLDIIVEENLIRLSGTLDLTGKKPANGIFLMDTGANYHLICFEKFVRSNRLLLSGFKPEGQAATVSMGLSSPVYYGKAVSFALGKNVTFADMPVTLQASTQRTSSWDNMPDGSIGIELFRQFDFTIDMARKTVHLRRLS